MALADAPLAPELSLEALAASAKPAVVQLQGLQKMSSGFFVTETGVIASNAHAARDEGSLFAMLSDGQKLQATVVYARQSRQQWRPARKYARRSRWPQHAQAHQEKHLPHRFRSRRQRSTRCVASLLSASGNFAQAHTHAARRRNVRRSRPVTR
jgi:hypothetical protein